MTTDRGPNLIPADHVEFMPDAVIIQTSGGPAWAETIGAAAHPNPHPPERTTA